MGIIPRLDSPITAGFHVRARIAGRMSDELLARAAVCPVAGPNRQLPHLALLAADSAFGRPCDVCPHFWGACLLL